MLLVLLSTHYFCCFLLSEFLARKGDPETAVLIRYGVCKKFSMSVTNKKTSMCKVADFPNSKTPKKVWKLVHFVSTGLTKCM